MSQWVNPSFFNLTTALVILAPRRALRAIPPWKPFLEFLLCPVLYHRCSQRRGASWQSLGSLPRSLAPQGPVWRAGQTRTTLKDVARLGPLGTEVPPLCRTTSQGGVGWPHLRPAPCWIPTHTGLTFVWAALCLPSHFLVPLRHEGHKPHGWHGRALGIRARRKARRGMAASPPPRVRRAPRVPPWRLRAQPFP